MIFQQWQLKNQLIYYFNNGWKRGVSTGWKQLDEHYTLLKGTMTFIGGYAAHGKSFFHLNLLRNTAELHNWRHLLFTPEMGDPSQCSAYLAELYTGKSFHKNHPEAMNEKDIHCFTAKHMENYTHLELAGDYLRTEKFISLLKEELTAKEYDTVSIDPWNELIHDFNKFGGREDKYLEYYLSEFRRLAEQFNVCFFIVAHPRTERSGKLGAHRPPPVIYDFSGGDVWASKGQNIIFIHRPEFSDDERKYPDHNQVNIHVRKIKPMRIGRLGDIKFFYNGVNKRLYWKDDYWNKEIYAEIKNYYYEEKNITDNKSVYSAE